MKKMKNRKEGVSVRFEKEDLDELDGIAAFNGLDRSGVIRLAVKKLIRESRHAAELFIDGISQKDSAQKKDRGRNFEK